MVPAPLSVLSITAALAAPAWAALTADLSSSESIKAAARLAVEDLLTFYHGNETGQIPGILPGPPPAGPYYWWQGGAMWGTLIDYWHYTNDTSYNDLIMQAMLFQTGDDNNYMPLNWTASLGNDDQAFWGMSALLAAETNFQNPPSNDKKQWLALAQAVFNTQASPDRHDNTCGGGLRWQIPMSNKGYDYKNSIANGCFFNMGARLARYTNNDSYAEWSRNTWDWMINVGFLDNDYNIYDGAYVWNCTDIKKAQFGYNAAVFLQGAAYMYNYTTGSEQETWKERTNGLLNATLRVFFPDNIAYEVACEGISTCNTDMRTYKGYLHRWMAVTAQIAPFTRDTILSVLKPSTEAALKTCTGGSNGRMCGFNWKTGEFSGSPGAGEQMDIISALTSYLVALEDVGAPLTNTTGGTSQGNPAAGTSSSGEWWRNTNTPAPTKDKVGAAFLTIMLLISAIAMFVWMSMDEKNEDEMFMGHDEKGKGKSVLDMLKL